MTPAEARARKRYEQSEKGKATKRRYQQSAKGYLKRRERDLLKQRAKLEKEKAWLDSQQPTNC
jgi:DNA-binding PadR family transcriptional regulator